MFGKKSQIIKYQKEQHMLRLGDSEPIFVRWKSPVTDKKAKIEVPANHYAFVIKSGDYGTPFFSGIHNLFNDKNEIKEWKKGFTLDILFCEKDKSIKADWEVIGDSSTIFEDKRTKETVRFLSASGSFEAKIINPTVFHAQIVGDKDIYRDIDLKNEATNYIISAFIDCFFNRIEESKIDFLSIVRYRSDIGDGVRELLNREISSKGYEFSAFKIIKLDLDISAAHERKNQINNRENKEDEILSEKAARIREIRREEEDREYEKQMGFAKLESQTKVGVAQALSGQKENEIKTIICPACGRENPADFDNCIFCHEKIKK